MRFLRSFVKWMFLLLLVYLFIESLLHIELIRNETQITKLWQYGVATVIFTPLYVMLTRNSNRLLANMSHEWTHMLVAVLMLKRITSFRATGKEGSVTIQGTSNWIIRLAPYFLPVYLVIVLLCGIFIPVSFRWWYGFTVVISWSVYIVRVSRDFSLRQSDIKESGKIFSTIIIVIINWFWIVFIFCYLSEVSNAFFPILFRISTSGQ
ncbi:MAG: hypothetical protein K8S56_09160 [Candidatus Cloacimonetes bacterium]|nr:hypothetical protein [Candidatus Cloacimonadota bacterium]